MEQSDEKNQRKSKSSEVKTFQIENNYFQIKENININTKSASKPSKEQLINAAIKFHLQGNILEAAKYYQDFLDQGYTDPRILSNYGIICRRRGEKSLAKKLYLQSIRLYPNQSEAYSNLGFLLKEDNDLEGALKYMNKAIKINPNKSELHLNLGWIFSGLSKLKEAEISFRKAIELDPNLAKAHTNLGGILRDLGKLQEAEIFCRKAIELNPDLAASHSNLGDVLLDLGKLQELIDLSQSTLKSKSINQGYKLFASLNITIVNLLKGNYSEVLSNINNSNELINQGAINSIKDEKNKKHSLTFSRFLTSLYPLLEKENKNPDLEKIPHFGESHCLSFAHQTLSISSQLKQIQPVLIIGAKAWHFANNKNNQWKDSLTQQIKNHTYSDKVFISFGEIDCRKDEGILNYAIKNDKDMSEVCEKTIKCYLDYMEKMLSPNYSKKYYFGVPAPTRKKELLDELDIKRIKIVNRYNEYLKKEVLSRGSYFVDVYALTSTKNGENNNLHMCDTTHLSPQCLSILFKNHLYGSDTVIF